MPSLILIFDITTVSKCIKAEFLNLPQKNILPQFKAMQKMANLLVKKAKTDLSNFVSKNSTRYTTKKFEELH